jgi:hypothetical protein
MLTAQNLLEQLLQVQKEGHDLSGITINFRTNYDSDIQTCVSIYEDLFDPETNSRLQSLVILSEDPDADAGPYEIDPEEKYWKAVTTCSERFSDYDPDEY